MPKTVEFHDDIVARAKAVAPSFKFPIFAQAAVREKIDREWRDLPDNLQQKLKHEWGEEQ